MKQHDALRRILVLAIGVAVIAVGSFHFGKAYQRSEYRRASLSMTAYLHNLDSAAAAFFEKHKDRDQVTVAELEEKRYLPRKASLMGEDYDSIFISRNRQFISLQIPGTYFSVVRTTTLEPLK